ncbi:hypothetical protein R1sor_014653 [Riccia sorocarpa]|uniref:Uncharacterized protein n=1 Tax=Riccia sorocarpa TaxID=122646 RepID=A0ABD3HDV5_9MARC
MAVTVKDVLNIQQSLRRYDPGHLADDAVATRNWTRLNPKKVVLYQEPSKSHGRPFTLAWQTDWMLGKLAVLGHRSTVSMDATFGTNKYGASNLVSVLTKVRDRVNAYRLETLKTPEEWRPNCFFVDDAKEENIALRQVG